jgi:hypothetical protein
MNTETKERSALDDFANAPAVQGAQLVPVTIEAPTPSIHGAQALAVYRDENVVRRKLVQAAAQLGEAAYYQFPVKSKNGQSGHVEGLSIKGAMLLCRLIGNVKITCPVMDLGNAWLFNATILDLESGFEVSRPFHQRKSAARMGRDSERNEDIAMQIGVSKAERNVVQNMFPELAAAIVEAAKSQLLQQIGNDPDGYRTRLIERLQGRLDIARVEAVIGRPAPSWTVSNMADVVSRMTAVTQGDAILDEQFPPLPHQQGENPGPTLDQFASEPGAAGGGSLEKHAPPAAADPNFMAEAVEKAIKLAANAGIDPEKRREALVVLRGGYLGSMGREYEDFLEKLMETALQVVNGDAPPDKAAAYLRGLIK